MALNRVRSKGAVTEVQLQAARNRLEKQLTDARRQLGEAVGPKQKESAVSLVAEIQLEM